jgi:hypothetical protein
MIRKTILGCIAVLFAGSPALAAEKAELLGVFQNWSAYSTGEGDAMTCYAISAPRAIEPKKANRGDIYLLVSDWPARKVKAEPEIVPGYPYKPGAVVTLGIGSEKFNFFSRNDEDKHGAAWLQNLDDTPGLMDALKNGVSAVAIGYSTRGTKTVDTYSLAGFTDAVAKIHAVCKM